MYNLKLHNQAVTLVDQVEDSLLNYFREHDLRIGDSIPNELDLAAALCEYRRLTIKSQAPK